MRFFTYLAAALPVFTSIPAVLAGTTPEEVQADLVDLSRRSNTIGAFSKLVTDENAEDMSKVPVFPQPAIGSAVLTLCSGFSRPSSSSRISSAIREGAFKTPTATARVTTLTRSWTLTTTYVIRKPRQADSRRSLTRQRWRSSSRTSSFLP